MPRIQILELPPSETELNPFALIVDGLSLKEADEQSVRWSRFGQQIGARSTLAETDTVSIGRADAPVPFGPVEPLSDMVNGLASNAQFVRLVVDELERRKPLHEFRRGGMPL